MACGQQKVKGGNGSITASIIASITARRITLNLGVGCAPSCWRIFGFQALGRCLKNCEIGVGFSFAALSVFRLRRAEAASAVWIPHCTRSLANRKGRGRRSGGREREPRRAGEASPKPPPKPPPKPRSGLCPELLADFRIPKPPGCSQGAQRAVFCAV